MLKPLETEFKGRTIRLECTHKRAFPPPQMYGSTPEDIDNLWRQGRVDQAQYQHLKVWQESCGLMIMGPKCLDCPLALKQNPRPGRPNVIETESWLEAKDRMHWDDMKAGKLAPEAGPEDVDQTLVDEDIGAEIKEAAAKEAAPKRGFMKRGAPVPVQVIEPEPGSEDEKAAEDALTEPEPEPEPEPVPPPKAAPRGRKSKKEVAAAAKNLDVPPTEAETSTEPDKKPVEAEAETVAPDLDESILDALADD
jgi:hypothetical protein